MISILNSGNVNSDEIFILMKYNIIDLIKENEYYRFRNIEQVEKISKLEEKLAKLSKNSSNSSKSPSSDIVKPKKDKKTDGEKRTKGGQKGHPKHEREKISPEEIDKWYCYEMDGCPVCGGDVVLKEEENKIFQQIEIKEFPIENSQHVMLGYWCENCQKMHWPDIPEEIKLAGLFGSQFTALIGYMKYGLHSSYSCMKSFI